MVNLKIIKGGIKAHKIKEREFNRYVNEKKMV